MAKIYELNAEDWKEFLAECPPKLRTLCKRYPPNVLFKLKDTGQRVFVMAYNENGTFTVGITGRFNKISFEREVFGIDPASLEECELPGEGEELGVTQTEEETEEMLASLRAIHQLRGTLQ